MKKYKLTIINTHTIFLKDVNGDSFARELEIKQTPKIFNTFQEMLKEIDQLKCGKDYHLFSKWICEEIEVKDE